MKAPKVVDLHTLQNLPEVLRKADFHKLNMELRTCLQSLPNMPDLHRFLQELKTSLPSMGYLPSLSNWYIVELLPNCLPERLSNSNHTDECVLQPPPLLANREPITKKEGPPRIIPIAADRGGSITWRDLASARAGIS
ncbi:Heptahelical transmembrane protein 5 [Abeliophyllum distichum]|uniref:Heptahelical transmembrane protein 5 n=1 Tax=Abeliophyllum distichum TaxID=126358 RepID=A0ABD1TZ76_9LAMI